jgi:hypothetical protein
MASEYIIVDNTVKRVNPRHPLDESLVYGNNGIWVRDFEKGVKFTTPEEAIKIAKELNNEAPVRVIMLHREPNRIGIQEIPIT